MADGDEKSTKKEILNELESIKGLLNEGDADIPMLDDGMDDDDIPVLDSDDDDIPVLDSDDDDIPVLEGDDDDDIPVLESEETTQEGMIVDEAALQDAIAQLESMELSPKSSKTRAEEDEAEKALDDLFEVEDEADAESHEEEIAREIAQVNKLAQMEAAHQTPENTQEDTPTDSAVAGSTLAAIQKLKERRLKKLTEQEAEAPVDDMAETMERPALSADIGDSLMDKIRANADAPIVSEAVQEQQESSNPFMQNAPTPPSAPTETPEPAPEEAPRRRGNVFLPDEDEMTDPAIATPTDTPIEFSGAPSGIAGENPDPGELTDGSAEIMAIIREETGEADAVASRPDEANESTVHAKIPPAFEGTDIDKVIDEVIEEYMVVLEAALRKKLKDKLSDK